MQCEKCRSKCRRSSSRMNRENWKGATCTEKSAEVSIQESGSAWTVKGEGCELQKDRAELITDEVVSAWTVKTGGVRNATRTRRGKYRRISSSMNREHGEDAKYICSALETLENDDLVQKVCDEEQSNSWSLRKRMVGSRVQLEYEEYITTSGRTQHNDEECITTWQRYSIKRESALWRGQAQLQIWRGPYDSRATAA